MTCTLVYKQFCIECKPTSNYLPDLCRFDSPQRTRGPQCLWGLGREVFRIASPSLCRPYPMNSLLSALMSAIMTFENHRYANAANEIHGGLQVIGHLCRRNPVSGFIISHNFTPKPTCHSSPRIPRLYLAPTLLITDVNLCSFPTIFPRKVFYV